MNPIDAAAGRFDRSVGEIDVGPSVSGAKAGQPPKVPKQKWKPSATPSGKCFDSRATGAVWVSSLRFVRRLRGAGDGLDLPGHVPLDREVLRRDVLHDHIELGGERFLEAGADALDVLRIGEIKRAHDAVDHRDRNLEAQARRAAGLSRAAS